MKRIIFFLILSVFSINHIYAQAEPIVDLQFHPNYSLPRNAENYRGEKVPNAESILPMFSSMSSSVLFNGIAPNERIINPASPKEMSRNIFTLEALLIDHVNAPIGTMIHLRDLNNPQEPIWTFGYYSRNLYIAFNGKQVATYSIEREDAYKNYWGHLIATYDGNQIMLYINNKLVAQENASLILPEDVSNLELDISGYLENEPYMIIPNTLRYFSFYDKALNTDEIRSRFDYYKNIIDKGIVVPAKFHFNAGPYLSWQTESSINIICETDRPANYIVEYGRELPLTKKMDIQRFASQPNSFTPEELIASIKIEGLEAGTQYFYNVKATDFAGKTIESGILTFGTKPINPKAFSFITISDTESRPHINNKIAQMIWDERPDFVINLGDITDGGKEPHKFEWNTEYFEGINHLHSRIPAYKVPGNGESDLYWYNRYNSYPEPQDNYSFTWGNAEFFMLNSNRKDDFAPGGAIYKWLDDKLSKSQALWKFVCLHHAPYSTDENDYGDTWKGESVMGDLKIREIVPLFDKYNVDFVKFGHLHIYSRLFPIKNNMIDRTGVIYLQAGGAGGNLEDFIPVSTWFSAKNYRGYHYLKFMIIENELQYYMYDIEGNLRDILKVTK